MQSLDMILLAVCNFSLNKVNKGDWQKKHRQDINQHKKDNGLRNSGQWPGKAVLLS